MSYYNNIRGLAGSLPRSNSLYYVAIYVMGLSTVHCQGELVLHNYSVEMEYIQNKTGILINPDTCHMIETYVSLERHSDKILEEEAGMYSGWSFEMLMD